MQNSGSVKADDHPQGGGACAYRFGPFELQPAERRLLRDGAVVSLPPRAFDVLLRLVERAGSLVTKDELLREVWCDASVEEANITVAVFAIRRVVGHDALVTVWKHGYRFVVPVERLTGTPSTATIAPQRRSHESRRWMWLLTISCLMVLAAVLVIALARPWRFAAPEVPVASVQQPKLRRLTNSLAAESNLAWSSQGRLAMTADSHGNSEIYVMDADGQLQRLTHHPGEDRDPAWSSDGRLLAFASDRGGDGLQIYVMNADGSHVRRVTKLSRSCTEPSWAPDGSTIVFQRNDEPEIGQDIYTIRIDGSQLRRLTDHRMSDISPAWSARGDSIAFASNRDGDFHIYVVPATGGAARRLTSERGANTQPSWSPDGTQIAFASNRDGGNHQLYLMNDDGSGQRRLMVDPGAEPAWSRDGAELAFISTQEGNPEVYVVSLEHSTNLTQHIASDTFAACGPDGTIAFTSNRDGKQAIYVMALSTGEVTKITDGVANDWFPSWSPDGRQLVFQSDRAGTGFLDLYVMDMNSRNAKRVTSGPGVKASPAWSPDGRLIAFQGNMGGGPYNHQIYTVAPDGSSLRRLTHNEKYDGDPAWSPDSSRIAFASDREGQFDVFTMSRDGRDVSRLTTHPAWDSNPSWSADGNKIVFASDRARGKQRHDLYVMPITGADPTRVTTGTGHWPRWCHSDAAIVFTSNRGGNDDLFLLTPPGDLAISRRPAITSGTKH